MGVFGDVKMKFVNGMEVETCSNEPGFAGAWFEGVIVSEEGGVYHVQYDKFETDDGHPLIEELDYSQIRPRPPQINVINWAAGDEIEVLDKDCWWKGVISKVLHKHCRVYFPDHYASMRCPYSNMRHRQEWKNGRWSLSRQARKRKTFEQRNAFEESTHEARKQKRLKQRNAFVESTHEIDEGFCSKLGRGNLSRHKLELFAYRSVLQAFHAQGSLSWEREILLTNLRLELHISCQEHTFVLEKLACGI